MKFEIPSRPDATPMNNDERSNMVFFTNAVSTLNEFSDRMQKRLGMVEDGQARAQELAEKSLKLLNDIRVTIPEKQRRNLYSMSIDLEMRMVPKLTPLKPLKVIPQDDFKELVDAAKVKCTECTLDENECEQCKLFKIFINVLPLSEYKASFLCPYNLATWGVGNEK